MKSNDIIKLSGTPTFTLIDEYGCVKQQFTIPNLIVNVGKIFIASRMVQSTANVMSHMEVGQSANNPTDGTRTTLVSPFSPAVRVGGGNFNTSIGASPNQNRITFEGTFGPGVGTGSIQEAGIFNASSGGTMLCRTTFNVINKAAADTLVIKWDVTVS